MTTIKYNQQKLVEEFIDDHREGRLRSGSAPPVAYWLSPQIFDNVVARTAAHINFGARQPDLSREEWITLHFAHGSTRVYMARSGVADDEIGLKEYTEL